MLRRTVAALALVVPLAVVVAPGGCGGAVVDGDEGEDDAGEGEGEEGEGEGNGEGEGEAAGEGEGEAAGEGEGEGEGEAGEGEGEAGEGEGEGEGEEADVDVDVVRLESDVRAFALPRPPGTPQWTLVQDTCRARLVALGFDVVAQDYATGTNIIGTKAGSDAAGVVVVGAHYDSVVACDGADDNASGLAAALEIARVLSAGAHRHDLVIACYDEEERGLIGSRAYVDSLVAAGTPVLMSFALETMGFASSAPDSQTLPFGLEFVFPTQARAIEANDNRGDFIAYVGDPGSVAANAVFVEAGAARGVPTVSLLLSRAQTTSAFLSDLRRSDHAAFWEQGLPGVMVTDTANFRNAAYHCEGADDVADRLDFAFLAGATAAVADTTRALLE